MIMLERLLNCAQKTYPEGDRSAVDVRKVLTERNRLGKRNENVAEFLIQDLTHF